jgi:hypothetical protein
MSIIFLLLVLIIPSAAASDAVISPAFDIIASDLNLIKTGLVNNDITFTAADFEKVLGVDKIDNITIVSLPLVTEGRLMLGSLEVMKNQTISRKNLDLLRFVPLSGTGAETSFQFKNNGSTPSYNMTCTLYVIPELNFAPTINIVKDNLLKLSTQKNITVFGSMTAVDPENDALTYEIVTQPSKGIIVVTDKNYGNYKYTPSSNFTGKDQFEYVVHDKYGNYSDPVKVTINVEKPASNVVYTDMVGHWAYNAAIKMNAAGIMAGQQVGSSMIFDPNGMVSRTEFLVMAMNSLGYNYNVSTVDTGFYDDSDIPAQYKGYVAAAYQLGYISGVDTENGKCFYPNDSITRAQAAVMLNNMLDSKQPVLKPAFADETTVPAWAENAIYALSEIGVLKGTGEGFISPSSIITRAQTAQMLYTVMEINKGK